MVIKNYMIVIKIVFFVIMLITKTLMNASDIICIKIIINVRLNINKSENIEKSCLLKLVAGQ